MITKLDRRRFLGSITVLTLYMGMRPLMSAEEITYAEHPAKLYLSLIAQGIGRGHVPKKMQTAFADDLTRPLIRRAYNLLQLRHSKRLKIKYALPDAGNELAGTDLSRFSLALSDANASHQLDEELPRIAWIAAAHCSQDAKRRLIEQLKEVATWSPIQRSGWSTDNQFNGGPWLGSGWATRAIVDSLSYSSGALPASLNAALHNLLQNEIRNISHSLQFKTTWYANDHAAYSNQWILPNEALLLASLTVNPNANRSAAAIARYNLLNSLDAQGPHGECVEGLEYASISVASLLSSALHLFKSGDISLIQHPYFRCFSEWYVHHLQPGGHLINAFDTSVTDLDWHLLAGFAAIYSDPIAAWALARHGGFDEKTVEGAIAAEKLRLKKLTPAQPRLWANYRTAARFNWRSSWDDSAAAGIWVRGGSESDRHDHMDRGHVNFLIGKRAIFIEAGKYHYGGSDYLQNYKSVAGHNVLQIGKFAPADLSEQALRAAGQILGKGHRLAPINVKWVSDKGGTLSVDCSRCYLAVEKWIRNVKWDRSSLHVQDEVRLINDDFPLFRWHLGVLAAKRLTVESNMIDMPGARLKFEANVPLSITLATAPDNTLTPGMVTQHTVVVIRPQTACRIFMLHTYVSAQGEWV